MACPMWQDTVVDLVVGTAPPARARAFRRHRARCSACRGEYASARSLATALHAAPVGNGGGVAPNPEEGRSEGMPVKRQRGPLLTLLAVVSLAIILLSINVAREPAPVAEPVAAPAAAVPAPAPAEVPPPTPAPAADAAYAGRTAGNEATIAIAVKDGRAVAYLCDGKKVEAWLEGTVEGSVVSMRGPDGATATGELQVGAVFGEAAAKGKKWPYSAALATPPAGTYRGSVSVDGVLKRIGWNVLPDGTVTGIVSDANGVGPAPPLDPDARTATLDGVPVDVQLVTGSAG
jgi:anti-sigma factor RsiW